MWNLDNSTYIGYFVTITGKRKVTRHKTNFIANIKWALSGKIVEFVFEKFFKFWNE